jgi:microcystin-dependent protein
MSEPFLAEVRIFGFNFAPRGWAFCDGQILPINQNQSLYSLLGTTYGGDGRTTFALPDLRGRTPIHRGASRTLGSKGGEETHTVGVNEMPQHSHLLRGTAVTATLDSPAGNLLATVPGINIYSPLTAPVSMAPGTVANAGAGQGHENMQPYITLSFAIALQGLFPSRNAQEV